MINQDTEKLCPYGTYILEESKVTAEYLQVISIGREQEERKNHAGNSCIKL